MRDYWVDQLRGFAIFVVVYIHHYSFLDKYLNSFVIPLFIVISSFYLPKTLNFKDLKTRFHKIILPYLIWSLFLFAFWVLFAKNIGESSSKNLSIVKNLIGIFYAQGGSQFMDWGIPMWFLPMIFCNFLFYFLITKITENYLYRFALGCVFSFVTSLYRFDYPWSLNIALVVLVFTFFGQFLYQNINLIKQKQATWLIIISFTLQYFLLDLNSQVSVCYSEFGNYFLFVFTSCSAIIGYILFFKYFINISFLAFIGKFTILILALHLSVLAFIKLCLLLIFNNYNFDFSEPQKFILSVLQVFILIPLFYLVNKYAPILNGGFKKI